VLLLGRTSRDGAGIAEVPFAMCNYMLQLISIRFHSWVCKRLTIMIIRDDGKVDDVPETRTSILD